jgi:hypothetical protein
MDVSTTKSATSVRSHDSADKAGKTKSGKHEAVSYAPEDKKSSAPAPEYKLEISEAAQDKKEAGNGVEAKVGNGFKDFDMDAFQGAIRSKLMQSIFESKKALSGAGVEFAKYSEDSILYDLSGLKDGDKTKAADVPEYWNAENTSQRIVDFAMSFRGLAPELTDEEYIEQVRKAVELGYKLAKRDLGDLPGPSAKLFNDTYGLTMKKFDDLVEQAKAKKAENAENAEKAGNTAT